MKVERERERQRGDTKRGSIGRERQGVGEGDAKGICIQFLSGVRKVFQRWTY